MTDKQTVGVLFGGRSGEHDVSLMSARFVLDMLDHTRYSVIEIGITPDGEWLSGENVLDAMQAKAYDRLTPVALLPDPTRAGLYRLGEGGPQPLAQLDVIFPVLHGTFGEDGTLQGLLEMAGMAYVGSGVAGAAVGMDKAIFADLMQAQGIPVVPGILVLRSELQTGMEAVLDRLQAGLGDYPYFVKPANLGSSVGVSKVKSRSDLLEGLLEAADYDRRVLVQKGLDVREIEVAVMGNDQPIASVCGEVLPGEEFYSYNAKYHDQRSRTVIPAEIPDETSGRIRDLAVQAYAACDMAGLARADFFLDRKSGEVYINEINTIPGFTAISMYPMLWAASGVSNKDLVEKLIAYALERKSQRDATRREFEREAQP